MGLDDAAYTGLYTALPREGWDAVDNGRGFSAALRSKGHSFVGGETHEGAGWIARRNRLDRLLATLFPLK